MVKRVVGLFLCLSLILIGCSLFKGDIFERQKSDSEVIITQETPVFVTLNMICYEYSEYSKAIWQKIKEGFENENRNVTLNITVLPWKEANVELETRLFNDEDIDIAVTDDLEKFLERDILLTSEGYTTEEMRSGIMYNIDGSFGMPVAGDVFLLYMRSDLAETSGISQESINSVGWQAILHGTEHLEEEGISNRFFIDVNAESLDLSKDVLYKSTNEKNEGVASSLINEVLNNKNIRHKTAYDGVSGVINGEIGMAVSPGSFRYILPMDGISAFYLPGEPYVLCDYFVVFKKEGGEEQNRLDAVKRFMDYFYGVAYEDFLSGEGYISTINFK